MLRALAPGRLDGFSTEKYEEKRESFVSIFFFFFFFFFFFLGGGGGGRGAREGGQAISIVPRQPPAIFF